MTRFGEQIRLEFEENGYLTVHLLTAPEPVAVKKEDALPVADGQIDLNGYEGHDPFNDTDLPVKLDE